MAARTAQSAARRFLQQSLFVTVRPCRLPSAGAPFGWSAAGQRRPTSTSPSPEEAAEVHLSDACVAQLRRLSADGSCLRLAVDGGGCSGFQYVFSTVEPAGAPQPDDVAVERHGVRVLVDRVSLGYIRGATIDYHQELIRSAFRIVDNPQSEQGCSCGASFSIKID